MNKKKPKYNLWQMIYYMIKIAWKVRKTVLINCLITAFFFVVASFTELMFVPAILNQVESAIEIVKLIKLIIFFTLALTLINGLNSYLSIQPLFARVEVRICIVNMINMKFSKTSFPNTENPKVTEILEKSKQIVSNNTDSAEVIWTTLTDFIKNLFGFSIYLIVLSTLNTFLINIVLVTTIVGFLFTKRINEWAHQNRDMEEAYIKKMSYISREAENLSLAKDVRIYGMKTWMDDVYRSTLNLYHAFIYKRESIYLLANGVDVILTVLRNGIAYFYLLNLVINSSLPASEFILYFNAISGFTTWITGILSSLLKLHQQCLDLSIVREFVELSEPFRFEGGIEIPKENEYTIELKNVTYYYSGFEKPTIENMNLIIKPKEKLAVVGLNGAGKTTLVKLICGFYDPTEGEVLLNGVDIRKFNRQDYYALLSAVFQQFSVLDVSIAENVAQTIDYDEERVLKCLELAGLSEKVNSFENQHLTHIGKNVYEDSIELSGGQTQRLMLARALYKQAPIIVLDEPTAALDPIAENDIYLKYNEMTKNCTSIFISHRLASTRFCDRILFLENGAITEMGTHEELIKLNQKYADLFNVQSKYYKEGGHDHE